MLRLKQRCSINMAPLIELQIKNMEDPSYAYLHCDLLNKETLTIITLRVKSFHIDMHKQYLKKDMFVKVEKFDIESKLKRGFEKDNMHVVIIVGSMTIVSPIIAFEPKLVPHGFYLKIQKISSKLKLYYYYWYHCWCKGRRE